MLTLDTLKLNPTLSTVDESILKAVAEMSANDENQVIGKKTGEIYGGLEKDILDTSGIAKNQGEKAYEYAKRVITDFKTKAVSIPEYEQKIETIKAERDALSSKIASGTGNEVLQKQLKDLNTQIEQIKNQHTQEKLTWDAKIQDATKAVHSTKINFEFEKALQGVKFKDTVPEAVRTTYIDSVKSKITSLYTPDFNEAGSLIFRDKDGQIKLNPANNMNPITAAELLKADLTDIIDAGKKVEGSGTAAGNQSTSSLTLDLSGARTQIQADDAIVTHLMLKGLTRGTKAFADEQKKLRIEYKVSELKMS